MSIMLGPQRWTDSSRLCESGVNVRIRLMEKERLESLSENRVWRRWCDVRRKIVPHCSAGNRERPLPTWHGQVMGGKWPQSLSRRDLCSPVLAYREPTTQKFLKLLKVFWSFTAHNVSVHATVRHRDIAHQCRWHLPTPQWHRQLRQLVRHLLLSLTHTDRRSSNVTTCRPFIASSVCSSSSVLWWYSAATLLRSVNSTLHHQFIIIIFV